MACISRRHDGSGASVSFATARGIAARSVRDWRGQIIADWWEGYDSYQSPWAYGRGPHERNLGERDQSSAHLFGRHILSERRGAGQYADLLGYWSPDHSRWWECTAVA